MHAVWPAVAVTATVAVVVYLNSLHGAMVFDDRPAIVENPDVLGTNPVGAIWQNNFWGQGMAAHDTQHQSYRPLTVLTFRWNHAAHGLQTYGYHVVNVALHAVVSSLFVLVCSQLLPGADVWVFSAAGVLFATHPVHVEAVAGLVGRAEVLAAVFFLLALLSYISACNLCRGRPDVPQAAMLQLLASLTCTALSVLCKEQGITVVIVCFAYDLFMCYGWDPALLLDRGTSSSAPRSGPRGPISPAIKPSGGKQGKRRGDSGQVAAFALRQMVLWAGFVLIMSARLNMNRQEIIVDKKTNPGNHVDDFVLRLLTKNLYVALHAWLLVFPRTLCCDWSGGSVPVFESIMDPRIFAIGALYAGLVWLAFLAVSSRHEPVRRAQLLVALALAIGPFIPSTGLFMEVGFVVAERVLYLPSLGYCLLVAIGLSRIPKGTALVFVGALTLAYSARTVMRNADWQDEAALYLSGVEVAPTNEKLHHNAAYYLEGERKEHHLREAIRLYPPYISAYINLGVHLSTTDRAEEAIEIYKKGVDMHYKYPIYSTDVGMIHRNAAQVAVETFKASFQ